MVGSSLLVAITTAGAIRMTGEAALRCGAGLVRVLTRSENIPPIITARPELMVHELTPTLEESLEWADVVVIGPGLVSRVGVSGPAKGREFS
ncbi:NAD(P)H-hydrate dehydratase [Shigella flexneri]